MNSLEAELAALRKWGERPEVDDPELLAMREREKNNISWKLPESYSVPPAEGGNWWTGNSVAAATPMTLERLQAYSDELMRSMPPEPQVVPVYPDAYAALAQRYEQQLNQAAAERRSFDTRQYGQFTATTARMVPSASSAFRDATNQIMDNLRTTMPSRIEAIFNDEETPF